METVKEALSYENLMQLTIGFKQIKENKTPKKEQIKEDKTSDKVNPSVNNHETDNTNLNESNQNYDEKA